METNKISLSLPKQRLINLLIVIGVIGTFIGAVINLNLEFPKFFQRLFDSGDVLKNFMTLDTSDFIGVFQELLVSICMAISSLFVGTILSFILAFLGARNITPHPLLSVLIKGMVSIIRAIPALVWILIIVASLGFGNTAGVVGMLFPTVGYLTKSFISSIEEQDSAIIETMRSTGANWFQVIAEGLMPNLLYPFLSWISIRLEGNIAESISLGMVGAGGIGAVLLKAIGGYKYGRISFIIVCIYLTMVSVELFVTKIKKQLR